MKVIMDNILSVLQQIFMGKEDNNSRVGLSEFKKVSEPVKRFRKVSMKKHAPQELKLSELMRRAY